MGSGVKSAKDTAMKMKHNCENLSTLIEAHFTDLWDQNVSLQTQIKYPKMYRHIKPKFMKVKTNVCISLMLKHKKNRNILLYHEKGNFITLLCQYQFLK